MSDSAQRLAFRGQLVLCVAALFAIVFLGLGVRKAERQLADDSGRDARLASIAVAESIEATFAELRVADAIAADIAAGALNGRDALAERMATDMEGLPRVTALSIAYLPECRPEFAAELPDAVVYFLAAFREEGSEDIAVKTKWYTAAQAQDTSNGDITQWYMRPLLSGERTWNDEATYSPATHRWWSGGYGVPFERTRPDGTLERGVVYADLSLKQVRHEFHEIITRDLSQYPDSASHAFLMSNSGRLLAHPDASMVENRRTLADLGIGLEDVEALTSWPPVEISSTPSREVRTKTVRDSRSGRSLNVVFTQLHEAGYWVAVVLDQVQVDAQSKRSGALHGLETRLGLGVLAFLLSIASVLFRPERGDEWRLWGVTLTFTVLCFVGVVALWVQYVGSHPRTGDHGIEILNSAIPQKLRLSQDREWGQEPVAIPTGVFVQSLEFSTANNVTVTGFIWQTHSDDLPDWAQLRGDEEGFTLPEAESASITKAYERRHGAATVTGWYVEAVLRQEFDYKHYPFDREDVWIRLWPARIGQGVMLIPDLAAYDTLVPTDLPGIESQNFVLEGWLVQRSFFSYRRNAYNTTFGFPGRVLDSGGRPTAEYPTPTTAELYFNVGLERKFLDPFIGTLIPIAVVALLLFGVLFTIRRNAASADQFGFNTSAVLGFCAALFFVVIVGHTSLRERLSAQGLIYFEHFFFGLYVALLFVSANSILVGRPQGTWVGYGDNLVARLAYWPLLSAGLLCVTLNAFG